MPTLARPAARCFGIAAPMPRKPPVTSATFSVNLDMGSHRVFCERFTPPLIQLSDFLSDVPSLQAIWQPGEYRLFPIVMNGVEAGESLFLSWNPFLRGIRRLVWTNSMQCRCSYE